MKCNTPYEYQAPNGSCVHKALFPMLASEWVGIACLTVGISLANIAGIGGGTLFVPIVLLLFQFTTSQSSPICATLVLLSSIVRISLSIPRKHPMHPNHPLIHYDTIILMCPLLLAFTKVGVILNSMLPALPITLLLICLLGFLAVKTLLVGLKSNTQFKKSLLTIEAEIQPTHDNSTVLKICNWKKIVIGIAPICALVLESLLVEGKTSEKSLIGIKKCSALYWTIFSLYFALSIVLAYLAYYVVKKSNEETRINDIFPFKISPLKLECLGMATGLIAGLFGIGGGVLINPILLQLGYDAEMSGATAIGLVFMSTISSSIQYAVLGKINWAYSGFLNIFTLAGTVISNLSIMAKIRKSRKVYILVYCLFAILCVAIGLLGFQGVYNAIKQIDRGSAVSDLFKFADYCPKKKP